MARRSERKKGKERKEKRGKSVWAHFDTISIRMAKQRDGVGEGKHRELPVYRRDMTPRKSYSDYRKPTK